MIFNQTILEEKMKESEEKALDYLLDNAETDKEISLIQMVIDILDMFGEIEFYKASRNKIFEELGIVI